MSVAPGSNQKALSVAAVIGPLVTVVLARALLTEGPQQAPAAVESSEMAEFVASLPVASALTPEQQAAIEYLTGTPSIEPARSPMPIAEVPIVDPIAEPSPGVASEQSPVGLALHSIVGKGERALASINNQIYRVGQSPSQGWRVVRIDAEAREVMLVRASDGEELVLGIETVVPLTRQSGER